MRSVRALSLVLLIALQSCGNLESHSKESPVQQNPLSTADVVRKSGIDLSAIDKSVRAQDDFHSYANGAWLRQTEIPPEYGKYGTFVLLTERAERDLKAIIQEQALAGGAADGRKIRDMYASYMDTEAIEAAGLSGVLQELTLIDEISSKNDLIVTLATLYRAGFDMPVGAAIIPDFKNSEVYAFYLFQGGIGLPDRDYFLDTDNERFVNAVADYEQYIADMLALAGAANAVSKAESVVALERKLAEAHWPRTENRKPEKLYNPYKRDELVELADFPWEEVLANFGVSELPYIVVAQPSYVERLQSVIDETPLDTWKDYLRSRVISDSSPYLAERFSSKRFDFYGRKLQGLEKQKERWRRGISAVSGTLGESLGKAYVEKHFPPQAKQRMLTMVNNLLEEFRLGIDELSWMSEETQAQAKKKLSKITVKIGYPDEWRDYSALQIDSKDLVGNMRRATEFEYDFDLAKLGQPINRGEWGMHPHRVNAYYNPTMNEIVFPAGILQPPMFDLNADEAANYGAAGLVIGHEISHGFDDQGSTFDGDGNLRNWWTEADKSEFKKATDKLVAQYNKFEPVEGMHINGELTLGENIGDLSGASVAVKAYQRSLGGESAPIIDGLTGLQRFFLGYARTWRTKYRDEVLARQLVSDPHSPHRERVNGIVQNMPEFYKAFNVKPGDGHYLKPEDRVKVW